MVSDSVCRDVRHDQTRLSAKRFDPKRVIAENLAHGSSEQCYYCFGQVGAGVLTVRFTYRKDVMRILGAGYWRKGKRIYERENQVHR